MYKENEGAYPSTDEGLEPVCQRPYFATDPVDPWGRPYKYVSPDDKISGFHAYSLGPDGLSDVDDMGIRLAEVTP